MDPRAAAGTDDLVVIPPRPRRAPSPPRRRRLGSALRWVAALTALLLVGSVAALLGWRQLADGAARDPRPGQACVTAAVQAAQDFAAVLGDTRPVDRRTVERSCVGRP